jgi:hypothetical protein
MGLTLLKQENGYSVYENPDAEIKQSIQNIEDPTELTEYWDVNFREDKWFFKELRPNGSVLLESDNGNLNTITKEEYDKEFQDAKLQKINKTFSVGDLVTKHFMPMYIGQKIYHKMFNQPLKMGFGRQESFYDGVNSIFMVESYYAHDGHYNTRFESSFGNGNGHMYFNLEGDITNRDYNQDLNDDSEFIPKEQIIQKFKDMIKNRIRESEIETTTTKDGDIVYFIEGFAFKIYDEDTTEIKIEWFPHTSNDRYFAPGDSYRKVVKPKKAISKINKEEFFQMIEDKCNNLIQNKFWEWTND